MFFATECLAIFAAASYPITRLSGVTIDGEDSASWRARSTLAVMPSTHLPASAREALAIRVIDSSRFRAITGSLTLSSNEPEAPANADRGSFPDHWGP